MVLARLRLRFGVVIGRCLSALQFGRMHAEIFTNLQLHSVDLGEKSRHGAAVIFRMDFHIA